MTTLEQAVDDVRNQTDLFPWYWICYGEKCYAFACVEAFPARDGEEYPEPGTELTPDAEDLNLWVGENGTKMLVFDVVVSRESQNGGVLCRFIALAHAALVRPLEAVGDSQKPCRPAPKSPDRVRAEEAEARLKEAEDTISQLQEEITELRDEMWDLAQRS